MPADPTKPGRLDGLLALYPFATRLAAPLVDGHLARRAAKGKEDKSRMGERKGEAVRPRPNGPLIWLHGASVGESLSVLPLIARLRRERPDINCLVTTGTLTSARLLRERLPDGAFHQFVPLDHPRYVDQFLGHWQPDLVLWIESEFWPNLLSRTKAQGIPIVLINARVSEKSFRNWQRFPKSAHGLMQVFDLCLAQTDAIAARLSGLGAARVTVSGNLKTAADPLPFDEHALSTFRTQIGARPRWLAVSTHDEEEALVAAHMHLVRDRPSLLTLIVPRQPDRGPVVAEMFSKQSVPCAVRSRGQGLSPDTQVYIADTIGETGLFYRLADIAFIGRTFASLGGSNPLEAVQLDCALLHGPHTENFSDLFDDLERIGAARRLSTPAELGPAVYALLKDDAARSTMIDAGCRYAKQAHAVLDTVWEALTPLLPEVRRSTPWEPSHASA